MIFLYTAIGLVCLWLAIILIRTLTNKPKAQDKTAKARLKLDSDKITKHLSKAITFETVSGHTLEEIDKDTFLGFHQYLEKTYPKLHSALKKEVVNHYSLLYIWPAKKAVKKPMVLMAHMDVVPVDERTKADWEHPPFSGDIADGYVWGRGTLDLKEQLIAICEAVEYMLEKGFEPNRDIYLAFGHDEECTGKLGAGEIVELLKKRKIKPEVVIDEGGVVSRGDMLGVDGLLGLIGISEKGYADITIEAQSKGGHAAQPPRDTVVSQIAEAIIKLKKHPMPATMNLPLKQFLTTISPYMKFPMKLVLSNLWCFKRLILKALDGAPLSSALTKTTFAPTMLTGSTASNVLAQRATATINFRISPDDSVDKLKNHVERVLRNTGVKITDMNAHNPTHTSDINSEAYKVLTNTIEEMMPELIITPYLMVGATDSRMYSGVADNIFLFSPFKSLADDLGTIHATGERITIESLIEGVEFFIRLLDNSCK